MDTEKVCPECGKHCASAQSYCPECGGALPAATPVMPGSASARGSHQLIINKGADERTFRCEDEEQALNKAMPWGMQGDIARIADEQGVVKWTRALSEGQVAVFKGDATVQRATSGSRASSGQSLGAIKKALVAILVTGAAPVVAPAAAASRFFDVQRLTRRGR